MYIMYFDHIHHTPTSTSFWILPLTDYLILERYWRLKGGENMNMNVCASDMVYVTLAGLELAMSLLPKYIDYRHMLSSNC